MRPRIALATYDRAPQLAPDDQALIPALAAVGIDAEPAIWSSDDVIWETFDAVVVRSCWDYHRRLSDFRDWLDRLDASRVPTWNPPTTLLWNADKRYLLALARRGVATIPTAVVAAARAPDGAAAVESIAAREGWARVVVKPAVSASGFETHALARPFDAAARASIERVVALGDVLVQPFAGEVARDGELSFVFIDGTFSHAAIKRAAGAEFRVQTEHGGSVALADVSPTLVEQAAHVLGALDEVPLYARVDGIVRDGAFLLMELELIEPNLFLGYHPGSAEHLASAIRARLG